MSAPFQLKQFSIVQDKCAMKVGTDAILLGAWAAIPEKINSILDIGTGTGILALQLAQRSDCELIDALEIEDNAYEQAVENFENSDWGDRLFCYHASLQEFVEEIEDTYDLIICNPPFYTDTFKNLETKRALARHTAFLNFEELLSATAKLMSPNGSCAFIIPFKEEKAFLTFAEKFGLFPSRITRVKGNETTEVKRSLLQLGFHKSTVKTETLVIEIARHQYTEAYKSLVQDFYLKM